MPFSKEEYSSVHLKSFKAVYTTLLIFFPLLEATTDSVRESEIHLYTFLLLSSFMLSASKEKYSLLAINVGDEGGFAPPLRVPEEALNLILKAAKNLGYQNKIKIILDVAASQFFVNGKYKMKFGVFTSEGLLRYYSDLVQKYPVLGLEDPFSEEDWEGFQKITKKFGKKIAIIGDDLLTTNPERIKEAYNKKACNAIILKPNQIGTITEAIEAGRLAKSYGWKVFVKQRGGETNDDFIADLAVGLGAEGIMTGAPARGERVAKYNRLLKIEEELHKD